MAKLPKKITFPICPFLWQTVLPYWFTFIKDGWFDWVKKGDGVIVQCANPKGVVAKIYKLKNDQEITCLLEIIGNKGGCQWNWKTGDQFLLPGNLNQCSILKKK